MPRVVNLFVLGRGLLLGLFSVGDGVNLKMLGWRIMKQILDTIRREDEEELEEISRV